MTARGERDVERVMKCFVTGGTGVVGRGVVRALTAAGHDVTVLTSREDKRSVVERLGASAVVGDMRTPTGWIEHARRADAIVHMAQHASGRINAAKARAAAEADRVSTRALLEAAEGKRAFVYTSGAWVYGPGSAAPRDETAPLNPFPLIEYKTEMEALVQRAVTEKGVRAVITRPGTVVATIGNFGEYVLKPYQKRKKAAVLGDGAQLANYIHTDECGQMYVRLVEDPRPGEVYNLGCIDSVSALQMTAEVGRLLGGKAPGSLPAFLAKLFLGEWVSAPLLAHNPIVAHKFVEHYGYAYRYPTHREVAKAVVDELRAPAS